MARRDYKLSIVVSAGAGTFAVQLTQGSCLRVDALKVRESGARCCAGTACRDGPLLVHGQLPATA